MRLRVAEMHFPGHAEARLLSFIELM
jgi:hypothetical protein